MKTCADEKVHQDKISNIFFNINEGVKSVADALDELDGRGALEKLEEIKIMADELKEAIIIADKHCYLLTPSKDIEFISELKYELTYWLFRKWVPKICIHCKKRYANHSNCIPF